MVILGLSIAKANPVDLKCCLHLHHLGHLVLAAPREEHVLAAAQAVPHLGYKIKRCS